MFKKIINCEYGFHHKEFESVSDEAKDLISKLLTKNVADRLSAAQALKHPWFSISPDKPVEVDQNTLDRLREYKAVSKLKMAAMNALVKMLSPKQIESLNA